MVLAAKEQDAGEWNGERIEGRERVGQAVGEDLPGVADEGPAAEAGGGCGQDEHPEADGPPGEKIVGRCARTDRALDAPEQAVSPVEADEREQPDEFRVQAHVSLAKLDAL